MLLKTKVSVFMAIPPVTREHLTPMYTSCSGCPSRLAPIYQVSTLPVGERTKLIHQFTTMSLVHQTKTGQIKNSLPLGNIHHELEIASLALDNSGASNILLSKVSFDCLITCTPDPDAGDAKKQYRDYLSFDLRIPGTNADQEAVFSYDMIEKAYGGKANLYAAIKHFYLLGRATVNAGNHKHGHFPDYDPLSSKHDQYIRHTEQLLVAYLALPEAAEMLRNRLRAEIRGKYPNAIEVKDYNMGVHTRSTKRCCGPCEYAFIGLMNEQTGFQLNGKQLGFLPNFEQACSVPNEQLTITLPQRSPFRLLVTVTASTPDAHHPKMPKYIVKKLKSKESVVSHPILVKNSLSSKRIFTSMLNSGFDGRKLTSFSNLSDKTVGISGSKATPGSPGTISKTRSVRKEEMDNLQSMIGSLKI